MAVSGVRGATVTLMPVALHHHLLGPTGADPVVLGGSLGSTHAMWDDLVADLSSDFRTIAFDIRGHGDSPGAVGPLTMSDLAADVTALLDRLDIERFHYVGLSLGGGIGQQLAIDAPGRVASLTLACTAASFGEPAGWHDRAGAVRRDGMGPLREGTGQRWFTDEARRRAPVQVAALLDTLVRTDADSYATCCEVLADFDSRESLVRITAPTRVITGALDPSCPVEVTSVLRRGIAGADEVLLEDAAHLANVCRPDGFATAVRQHLRRHPL